MATNDEEESGSDVAVLSPKPKFKRPPQYAVIIHNDDYTTMEFVIEVLMKFFHKNMDQAAKIMLEVHQKGRGVAGIYSYDIAETKCQQVVEYARSHGHPLLTTVEPV